MLEHNLNECVVSNVLIVPFGEKNLTVPVKATPWPSGRAKRISVNSFGIGGSNAHVSGKR